MEIPLSPAATPAGNVPSAMPMNIVGGYQVPVDPMELLQCDSCQ